MTADQRIELHDAMMRGIPKRGDDMAWSLLDKLTWEEIARIEPIVDQMCFASFRAGQRFSGHKTEAEILHLEPER